MGSHVLITLAHRQQRKLMMKVFAVALAGLVGLAAGAQPKGLGLAIGGYGASNTIELVTPEGTCYGSDIDPPFPVSPSGSSAWIAEYVDNAIYICGGQNIDQRSNCYKADIGAGSTAFSESCPLSTERRYPSSLVFDGQLVVMGGFNEMQGWLDSVDIKAKGGCEFSQKEEWKLPRGMYNFCAVSHKDKIYTIGGTIHASLFDNSDIANVDVLDTKTNTWSAADPLPIPRESPACMVTEVGGKEGILVTGGCNNNCLDHLDDTLFFDFATEKWETLEAKLNTPRMRMKMVDVSEVPTVIGGYYNSLLDTIEEFDGKSWTLRDKKLHYARYAYGMPSFIPENMLKCKN